MFEASGCERRRFKGRVQQRRGCAFPKASGARSLLVPPLAAAQRNACVMVRHQKSQKVEDALVAIIFATNPWVANADGQVELSTRDVELACRNFRLAE